MSSGDDVAMETDEVTSEGFTLTGADAARCFRVQFLCPMQAAPPLQKQQMVQAADSSFCRA